MPRPHEHPDLQLRAGCGLLLYTGGFGGEGGLTTNSTGTDAGIAMLHDIARRVLYRHCNSNAMDISRDYTPYWIGIAVAVNILLVVGMVLIGVFMIYTRRRKHLHG